MCHHLKDLPKYFPNDQEMYYKITVDKIIHSKCKIGQWMGIHVTE